MTLVVFYLSSLCFLVFLALFPDSLMLSSISSKETLVFKEFSEMNICVRIPCSLGRVVEHS